MKLILVKKIPYVLDNNEYEIRIYKTSKEHIVQTYKNDKRADTFTYTVKHAVKAELESKKGEDVLAQLVNAAKEGLKIHNNYLLKKASQK